MVSALAELLEERRFEECRNLAEETLHGEAQTTSEAAWCHYAIAHSSLELGDALSAAKSAEQALLLARKAADGELARLVLMDLANSYGRLRRYGAEARALQRYLQLAGAQTQGYPGAQTKTPAMQQGWHALGTSWMHRDDYDQATRCFREAIALATETGDEGAAEASRRALRTAAIRSGHAGDAAKLLAASRAYLKGHRDDQAAHFWYWHDRSDLAAAALHLPQADKAAWLAVSSSTGDTPLEFAGHMLHYRNAVVRGNPTDAMRFACDARVSALLGQRFDLAHEAVDAMIGLIQHHGPVVFTGLAAYYARRGVNLATYIPEELFGPQ